MGDAGSFRAVSATFLFATLVAGGAWAAVAAPGCSLSNCDPAFEDYTHLADGTHGNAFIAGGDMAVQFPEQGFLDENTWQSAPVLASWHKFTGQHTYGLELPWGAGFKFDVLVYLAVDADPNVDDSGSGNRNYALGAGNIAETINFGDTNYVQIRNDSCAQYFFRVVVRRYPIPDAGSGVPDDVSQPPTDAPSDTLDSGTTDAALDVADSGPIDASSQ